ncbi:MAG: hypothetical protein U0528_12320 [Anaerolineae bacterium]|nr:hypothetical protein [Anaerolineae bacterium]
MTRGLLVLLILVSLLFMPAIPLAAQGEGTPARSSINLVVNGSFELPVVGTLMGQRGMTGEMSWDLFTTDQVPGWKSRWADTVPETFNGSIRPLTAFFEIQRHPLGWQPAAGEQHIELDSGWSADTGESIPASISIYQDLATCAKGEYILSFAWSPRPNEHGEGMDSVEVGWNGETIDTYSGKRGTNTKWTYESINVTASSEITRLEFAETGTPDTQGMFLDDVSLTLVSCEGK